MGSTPVGYIARLLIADSVKVGLSGCLSPSRHREVIKYGIQEGGWKIKKVIKQSKKKKAVKIKLYL